jgi:hypothetical protein
MEIEVWSVGKARFTADPEYQEPVIREAIDQRGDVADVILDYTDSERSDISYDEYARVTGDVPGLVLFEGWLTGSPDGLAQIIDALAAGARVSAGEAVAARHAAEAGLPPEAAAIVAQAVPALAAAEAEARKVRDVVCKLLDLFGAPDDRLMQRASVTRATLQRYAADAGVRLDGQAGT